VGTWGNKIVLPLQNNATKTLKKTITFLKSVVLLFTSAPALSMADRFRGVPPENKRRRTL
jgi:hypothetical protein